MIKEITIFILKGLVRKRSNSEVWFWRKKKV